MSWIVGIVTAILGLLRSRKPQATREAEDLGRAQASLDVISQGQSASAAEAQAVAAAPHDAFGVIGELQEGKF